MQKWHVNIGVILTHKISQSIIGFCPLQVDLCAASHRPQAADSSRLPLPSSLLFAFSLFLEFISKSNYIFPSPTLGIVSYRLIRES